MMSRTTTLNDEELLALAAEPVPAGRIAPGRWPPVGVRGTNHTERAADVDDEHRSLFVLIA
jgi:hypothetical protein